MSTVKFLARTKIRQKPSISAAVLGMADKGSTATTLQDKATPADGYSWWLLKNQNELTGWCAEYSGQTTLFEFAQTNFSEEFERCIGFTLRWEGGYVNNPADPGGETKYGISKRSYPNLDIKNLTLTQAKEIYYRDYWLRAGCGTYVYPKNQVLFDVAVLTGVGRATLLKSYSAIGICAMQYYYYASLSTFSTFGAGWVNRNTELLAIASVGL